MTADARLAGTRATYDRIAEAYAARSGEDDVTPEFRRWRDAAAAAVDGPVADLGCGPGRDLAVLATTGHPCVGVDLSTGMLALARRAGPVVRGDLRRPPLRPGSLAVVYSTAALLHVPREDVPATLAAWRALLRPGGTLHLSTSLGGNEGWEAVPYAPDRGQPLERWFVHHDLNPLVAAVTAAGFDVVAAGTRTSHREWVMLTARTHRA